MFALTSHTKVSELANGPPGIHKVLLATGLFREGDDPDVMLGELCWNFGFNPGMLLMMLEAANVPEEVPPLDITPFQDMPLVALVDHIEQDHHGYLRDNLPKLTTLTAAVAAAHVGDENLAALDKEMQRIAGELYSHLNHEEEALFAMIRELGMLIEVTPTRCGGSVGGPIACMENEHAAAVATLQRMRKLTNNYTAAVGASSMWQELLGQLAFFDQDLREHMYKEDKALFPRALEAQRGAQTATAN